VTDWRTIPLTKSDVTCYTTSFLRKDTPDSSKPRNKHVWATLDGKDAALDRLMKQVAPRHSSHIHHKVALCDGCEALQSRIEARFPDFTLILDFIPMKTCGKWPMDCWAKPMSSELRG